jgi:hypothetical protein
MVMSSHDMQALAGVDVPQTTCKVVAAAGYLVPAYIDTSHAVLMTVEHTKTLSMLNVPDP